MLEFSVGVTLDGETLTPERVRRCSSRAGGLVAAERASGSRSIARSSTEVLTTGRQVAGRARAGRASRSIEGMRLLAGLPRPGGRAARCDSTAAASGRGLRRRRRSKRSCASCATRRTCETDPPGPARRAAPVPADAARGWLRLPRRRLGLGACLADDMGLGKTIQVIALLCSTASTSASDNGRQSEAREPASSSCRPR